MQICFPVSGLICRLVLFLMALLWKFARGKVYSKSSKLLHVVPIVIINNNNLFLIRHKLTSAWIWSIHRLNYQLLFRKWARAPLPNRWLDAWVCYCWLPPIRSLHAFSNLAGSIKFIFPWQADLKRQMQRCCFMGCAIMSYFKLRNLI